MDAVDVPSPALSCVLLATSWTNFAPIFANGSDSSMSFAIVTPSLIIVGLPHDFSSTTVLAAGPSVTLTAFATASIPSSNLRRASSPYNICFAILVISTFLSLVDLRLKVLGLD